MKKISLIGLMLILMVALNGCKTQTCVVAHTGTIIGLEATYLQETQTPYGRLGYVRSELAVVPTNRVSDDNPGAIVGDGAKDSANVLMELSFTNFFSFWNDNGIYQRLAVGDKAVTEPGAVAMFAKNKQGEIDPKAVEALAALKNVQSYSDDRSLLDLKVKIADLYKIEANKKEI